MKLRAWHYDKRMSWSKAMDQQLVSRGQRVSTWLGHVGDHTILIIAALLPLILAVITHSIGDSNDASLVGWIAGMLLSFYLAWVVWQRTGLRLTRALAIVVVCLWLVYAVAALF
jgi:hypothetical protein